MSVLACGRRGCDNIMCDTYINGIGYICESCKDDFRKYVVRSGACNPHSTEIYSMLYDFMDTPKGDERSDCTETVDDFFRDHTND